MRNDNQGYKRTPAQLRNIAERKQHINGQHGRVPPIQVGTPWWTKPMTRAEFTAAHTSELPRITAVRTTYRYAHDEGI